MATNHGSGDFEVGQRVRVALGPGKSSRCLILCVGSDAQGARTYDVLLVAPDRPPATTTRGASDQESGYDREITGLPERDLSPLQPFEHHDVGARLAKSCEGAASPATDGGGTEELAATIRNVEAVKEEGNVFFKLGDIDAAAEIFAEVVRALQPPPTVGANVLVKSVREGEPVTIRYRPGIISDASDDNDNGAPLTYDIIFDERDADGDDEEDGVTAEWIVTLPISPCLSCAARLNLARCSFKVSRHQEVVDACTFVISLAKFFMADKARPREERVKLSEYFFTALRLRGGSHLAQNHISLARKDARSMCSAGDDARRAQAARFEAEVERKGKALLKANRKLARDVSQWVNASMARHDEAVSTGELGTGGDGVELGPSARDAQNMNVEDEGNGCGGVEEMKGRDGMEREGDGQSVGGGGVSAWLGGWLR